MEEEEKDKVFSFCLLLQGIVPSKTLDKNKKNTQFLFWDYSGQMSLQLVALQSKQQLADFIPLLATLISLFLSFGIPWGGSIDGEAVSPPPFPIPILPQSPPSLSLF